MIVAVRENRTELTVVLLIMLVMSSCCCAGRAGRAGGDQPVMSTKRL